jgi:hypothetical protein
MALLGAIACPRCGQRPPEYMGDEYKEAIAFQVKLQELKQKRRMRGVK